MAMCQLSKKSYEKVTEGRRYVQKDVHACCVCLDKRKEVQKMMHGFIATL